jgi:hypothetical protein
MKSFKSFYLKEQKDKNYVVAYVGRFQPAHKNHYKVYSHLVNKFGKEHVYIGTSDKTDKDRSLFNFKEKKKILNTMFSIPKDKIIKVKNPYAPKEITGLFPEDTVFISAIGEKDANRITKGKYFDYYTPDADKGYLEKGYVYIVPLQTLEYDGELVSGSSIRKIMKESEESKQLDLFKNLYGKFNKTIFNLIKNKLENK